MKLLFAMVGSKNCVFMSVIFCIYTRFVFHPNMCTLLTNATYILHSLWFLCFETFKSMTMNVLRTQFNEKKFHWYLQYCDNFFCPKSFYPIIFFLLIVHDLYLIDEIFTVCRFSQKPFFVLHCVFMLYAVIISTRKSVT